MIRGELSNFVMVNENCIYLTQSCLIRGLSKKQYNVLVDVCLKINDIRNCAVELTPLVKSDDDVHYNDLNFISIISRFKKEYKTEYSYVQVGVADATIKKHDDNRLHNIVIIPHVKEYIIFLYMLFFLI